MFFGLGLSRRSVFSVLRPTPRPHGGGVRQHFRRRESACRLGGNVFSGVGNRVVSEIARREVDLGARPPPRRLHPPRNGRGYAAVAGFVHRPQRIQRAGIGGVEGGTSRRGGAGSSRIAAKRHRTGRRGRLDQQTAESRRITPRKKNSSWRPIWASCTKCKSRRPTKNLSPHRRRATAEAAKAARSARGWR